MRFSFICCARPDGRAVKHFRCSFIYAYNKLRTPLHSPQLPCNKIHSSPEKNPRQMESREKKSNNTDYLPLGARTVKTRFNVCCAQNRETFEDLHGLRQLCSISQHGLISVNGYRISPPYLRWHPSANPHSTAVTYCVRMIRRNL